MPYKVTISRGKKVLGSVTKSTQEAAVAIYNKWYGQAIARITELMDGQGQVTPEFRHPMSYALKPTYYTTCKIPLEQRTETEEYLLSFEEVTAS